MRSTMGNPFPHVWGQAASSKKSTLPKNFDLNHGDVVATAVLVGERDEPETRAAWIGVAVEHFGDGELRFFFVIACVVGQTIRAEQDDIAGDECHLKEVDIQPSGFQLQVGIFVECTNTSCDQASAHQCGDGAQVEVDLHLDCFVVMVHSDLLDGIAVFEVGATVSEVGKGHVIAVQKSCDPS